MKKILGDHFMFVCFLFFFTHYIHGQGQTLKALNIKGQVKSFNLLAHWTKSDVGEMQIKKDSPIWDEQILVKFNKKGYKIETNYFGFQNKFQGKDVYKYDKTNLLKEIISTDTLNEIIVMQIYTYNHNGSLDKIIDYDKNGILIEYENYENQGEDAIKLYLTYKPIIVVDSLSNKTLYYYGTNNKIIKEIDYDINGEFASKSIYSYYQSQNLKEIIGYNSYEIITYKSTYVYDSKNNVLENKIYIEIPPLVEIELIIKDGIEYEEETTYFYDELELESKTTYSYTYDVKGNWIKKIVYKNDTPYKIIERNIVYF